MKIVIVGSDKVFAIENFYFKYLSSRAEVYQFSAQSKFYDYYGKSYINKIAFKLGISSIYATINWEFKELITQVRPDVILVFKGMELYPETLRWAKERKIFLANYNPDNPFLFSGKGSGNKNITDSIRLYDLHFTYDRGILQELARQTPSKTALLPFGFHLEQGLFEECKNEKEVVKACFLGNPDKFRASFLKRIAENVQIDVYGNDWKDFLSHPNVAFHEPVYGNDLWITLRKYRVQLNLMRPHNPESHNMRSFEVPAVGGILLAPDTMDHREYFTPGKEIFIYKDIDDCVGKIKYLVSLPAEEADMIRKAARTKSINAGYSYEQRASDVYNVLKEQLQS